jgi:Fur family transcriptional regulator, ferric uptake regulator
MNKVRARDVFQSYVREKGLRNTTQREQILDAFLSANKHITADELFEIVKERDPEIGYATIHRNLALFCKSGVADEIKIGTQKTRYEPKVGQEHHDHLICTVCGRFVEVSDEKIEELQQKLAEAHDFVPSRHKLEIYGTCRECR